MVNVVAEVTSPRVLPYWSAPVAVKVREVPAKRVPVSEVTVIDANAAAVTLSVVLPRNGWISASLS